ncbi:MAG TPA: putative DNA binding domain-containing protein [Candidatus Onthocola stercorigallinarum]|nr:putative DNA binding domain-containing protein [Candidatus Onthocola stercorigallinarum]
MQENENVEFKEMFTENIYKEIVAFLNTCGGTIYIGYNDAGDLVGLNDAKKIEEHISVGITQKISPDCSVFVTIDNNSINDLDYIVINVSKGISVYSLKDKGILKGTYIRNGSCSIPASEETVKQMIIKNSNLTFETSVSINQDLTFNYIKESFDEVGIDVSNKNIMKNLSMLDKQDKYTNLALLLSDQNPYTLKIATYESVAKSNFLDRKEFSGSLLEIYDKTLDYLKLNSATYGLIDGTIRKDIEEYPEFIIREILLNSLIHRDYSTLTSNIINIYKNDSIEFISYGSLYGNITIADALAGLSTSRNPHLQSIFMRLKRVEAIGSGLRRVSSYYKTRNLELIIEALPSSFVVRLPRITMDNILAEGDDKIILEYLNKTHEITRKKAEELIGKEKTTTANLLNKMLDNKIIKKVGNGPNTKYIL